jgi:hypothetical protein
VPRRPRHAGLLASLLLAGCSSTPSSLDDRDAAAPDAGLEDLQPGSYLSPLVQLKRLQGVSDHLHVDEVRLRQDGLLLQCSYTFGVVDATDASRLRYLSQNLRHTIPGDTRRPGCIHLAWDGDIVYTTHRGNIRNPTFLTGWDISDPGAPVQLPVLQEPGISYAGIDVAKGNIYVGLHEKGLGVYSRDASNELVRVGTATGFTSAWGVIARDDTVFVADGPGGLVTVDVTDPASPTVLGQVVTGGHATGVVVSGDIAYVAAGSAGLVVVDISDLANPVVIGSAQMPGSAIRVDYSAGHVFVAAWNDARAYDVSVPASPRFIGAVRLTHDDDDVKDADRPIPTSRIFGIAARGDEVFIGNWHVIYSYRLYSDRLAPSIRVPEAASMLDFGPLDIGQSKTLPFEVSNQGTAPLTLLNNWIAGDAFTVTPRQVRIAPGERAMLSLTYTATTTELEKGYLQILSDDPQEPRRVAYLVGNQPGLGVGMPLPETTAVLLEGSSWSSSQTQGKVVLLAYFATF